VSFVRQVSALAAKETPAQAAPVDGAGCEEAAPLSGPHPVIWTDHASSVLRRMWKEAVEKPAVEIQEATPRSLPKSRLKKTTIRSASASGYVFSMMESLS
jgi:hypothetical protein